MYIVNDRSLLAKIAQQERKLYFEECKKKVLKEMCKEKTIELLKARRKRMLDDNELKRAGQISKAIKDIQENRSTDYNKLKNTGLIQHTNYKVY